MKIEDLYEKTNDKKIEIVAELLKYRYAGHVVRDSNEKWSKIMISWVPHMGDVPEGG